MLPEAIEPALRPRDGQNTRPPGDILLARLHGCGSECSRECGQLARKTLLWSGEAHAGKLPGVLSGEPLSGLLVRSMHVWLRREWSSHIVRATTINRRVGRA